MLLIQVNEHGGVKCVLSHPSQYTIIYMLLEQCSESVAGLKSDKRVTLKLFVEFGINKLLNIVNYYGFSSHKYF